MTPIVCFNVDVTLQQIVKAVCDGRRVMFLGADALEDEAPLPPSMLYVVNCGAGDSRLLDGARNLKATHRGIPLIVTTAQGNGEVAAAALRLGAWDYVVLPREAAYLRRRVRQWFAVRETLANEKRQAVFPLAGVSKAIGNSHYTQSRIHSAIEYLSRNYARNITPHDLARACFMTVEDFETCFLDEYGMPPEEFLQHFRLGKAVDLLDETRLSVREIAVLVGFRDPLVFAEAFRGAFGVSPAVWREPDIAAQSIRMLS